MPPGVLLHGLLPKGCLRLPTAPSSFDLFLYLVSFFFNSSVSYFSGLLFSLPSSSSVQESVTHPLIVFSWGVPKVLAKCFRNTG